MRREGSASTEYAIVIVLIALSAWLAFDCLGAATHDEALCAVSAIVGGTPPCPGRTGSAAPSASALTAAERDQASASSARAALTARDSEDADAASVAGLDVGSSALGRGDDDVTASAVRAPLAAPRSSSDDEAAATAATAAALSAAPSSPPRSKLRRAVRGGWSLRPAAPRLRLRRR